MDRSRKTKLVTELKQHFAEATLVVVAQHEQLAMADSDTLRQQVYDVGATFKVTKNSLAKMAIREGAFEYLSEHFVGQTAVAFSKDEVSAAKVLHSFGKESGKIRIVGGGMANAPMTPESLSVLATLPDLDALRGKLVGLLQAPATKLAGVTQAPAAQLARVFGAYAKA